MFANNTDSYNCAILKLNGTRYPILWSLYSSSNKPTHKRVFTSLWAWILSSIYLNGIHGNNCSSYAILCYANGQAGHYPKTHQCIYCSISAPSQLLSRLTTETLLAQTFVAISSLSISAYKISLPLKYAKNYKPIKIFPSYLPLAP